jgi:hypothetical protein
MLYRTSSTSSNSYPSLTFSVTSNNWIPLIEAAASVLRTVRSASS